MNNQDLSYAVLFDSSKKKAISQMTKCMYPGSTDNAKRAEAYKKANSFHDLSTFGNAFVKSPF